MWELRQETSNGCHVFGVMPGVEVQVSFVQKVELCTKKAFKPANMAYIISVCLLGVGQCWVAS